MILFHIVHPPAAATTLIVSLGIIHEPSHLALIELAIVLLAAQAFTINRLAGVDYPWWGPKEVNSEQ
jgi:CBS-domain-containing membrane protein